MEKSNRAKGWKYAKLSGHENEKNVDKELLIDEKLQQRILNCLHKETLTVKNIQYGGLNEKDVDCILGGKTKSKTDIKMILSDNSSVNISIKKSLHGQVFLIGIERFIEGIEKQYNIVVPDNVKKAISLFWGDSIDIVNIINEYSDSLTKRYELKKHRLVANTLLQYDNCLYNELLEWFSKNSVLIFDFCFSRGLAKNKSDWSDILRYKNTLNENSVDEVLNISELKRMINEYADYGKKSGGTTIQLSFGFVQRHSPKKNIPGQMQFHHSYEKIIALIDDYISKINK